MIYLFGYKKKTEKGAAMINLIKMLQLGGEAIPKPVVIALLMNQFLCV